MFNKLLILLSLCFILTGCGNTTDNKPSNSDSYTKITIKTELKNEESKDDSYLVYLALPGSLPTKAGDSMRGAYLEPLETDANGEVIFDLEASFDLGQIMDMDSSKEGYLQVVIVTKEDGKNMRNPLNKETYIKINTTISNDEYKTTTYVSPVKEINIPFTDKYPDGVLSLKYQDASFVIKLSFDDNYVPTHGYEVSIYKADPTATSGIGNTRLARMAGDSYETAFYKSDNLKNWSGTIVITNSVTNARITYDGYPKQITFDDSNKCIQGDIITIKMPNL